MSKLLEFALIPVFFFSIALYQCSKVESQVAGDKIKKQEKQNEINRFNSTLDTIREFIFKQEYSLAENRIQELKNTHTQNYQINEVENLLIDHQSYMNICKTWSYEKCVEYLNNPKLDRYSEQVKGMQYQIIDKDYQLSSKINNMASWKFFLEKYPCNPYEYQVRNTISELEFEIQDRKTNKIESNQNRTYQQPKYVKPTAYSASCGGQYKHSNDHQLTQLNISRFSSNPTYSHYPTYNAPNSYNYPSTYVPNTYVNPNANPNTVYVRGYTRKDGTVVRPHIRTAPNSTKTDNLRYR